MARRRASMREGPLAELFKATEAAQRQAEKEGPGEGSPPVTGPDAPTVESAAARPAPASSGGDERAEPPAPEREPDAGATAGGAADRPPAPDPNAGAGAPAEPPVRDRPAAPAPSPAPNRAPEPAEAAAEAVAPPAPERRPLEPTESRPHAARALVEPPPRMRTTPRPDSAAYLAVIRVIGVGGAGLNAVNRMIEAGISQVEFIAVNTDIQQLKQCEAPIKLHIGRDLTQGLGSGADPEVGRRAAEEAQDQIKHVLRGSDMVFVTAGEGGGTGSGAAPIVAQLARDVGALTVGIVTMPFRFEGTRRRSQADAGVEALREVCDTVILIPNDRLLEVLDRQTSMLDAFRIADDVLRQGVQGICDLITMPGLINLDFADVRTIMSNAGSALMGIGFATGDNRAHEAAERALRSPLIDTELVAAKGILLSIAGGEDLTLLEVNEAAEVIRRGATEDTNIIFGATIDERLAGQVWVTVIATGIGKPGPGGGRAEAPREPDPLEPPSFLGDL
ncbi:MAG TPA: cell division protein FtsZ [Gaiellaceae bacterium]|nr:cell division protein FtsZ [Gaiellaceae bacterium]